MISRLGLWLIWLACMHSTMALTLHLPNSTKVPDVRTFFLASPSRYVVDYHGPRIKHKQVTGKSRWVKTIKQGQHPKYHRWVFYTQDGVALSKRWLKGKQGWALRLSFSKDTKNKQSSVKTPTKKAPRVFKKPRLAPVDNYRDVVVVIDPGHGGKDPGGVGRSIKEKDIVLSVAKRLARQLKAVDGIKVVLTRDRDRFISLGQRQRISRKHKADLFIAIHADAYFSPKAHGASVFALSSRGATSVAARWLAKRENQSLLAQDAMPAYRSHHMQTFLADLQKNATVDASLELGQIVLNRFAKVTHLHHKTVEQAGFAVLKSLRTPSVLIELGFVSNPAEAKRLKSAAYQKRLARAITRGIEQYLQKRPPPQTHWYARAHGSVIRVKKGDTLSTIAHRWHLPVSAIKAANHLKGDRLLLGQSLTIPPPS